MVDVKKLEYIESLSNDEVRYEIDKIYARLKEIEILEQIQDDLPSMYFNPMLSILKKDREWLNDELALYQARFFDTRTE